MNIYITNLSCICIHSIYNADIYVAQNTIRLHGKVTLIANIAVHALGKKCCACSRGRVSVELPSNVYRKAGVQRRPQCSSVGSTRL